MIPSRTRPWATVSPVAAIAALLWSASMASPASAQVHEREHAGRDAPRAAAPAPAPRSAPAYSGPGRVQGAAPPRGPEAYQGRYGYQGRGGAQGQGQPPGQGQGQGQGQGRPGPGAYAGSGGNPGYGRGGRDGRWDRGGGDRHEWRYRGEVHPGFRLSPFRYPSGWGYRSWRIGERLPFLFLTSYYFLDYDAYDLPPPPYGYRWVRYGPDALLVNVYTGEVEDVVYGIFYW